MRIRILLPDTASGIALFIACSVIFVLLLYGLSKRQVLRKAIARKPLEKTTNRGIGITGEYDIESVYLCPLCSTCVGDIEGEWVDNYCHECGQKIDRSVIYDETN